MARTPRMALWAAFALFALVTSAAAQEERIFRPPGGGNAQGEISLYRAPGYAGPYIRAQTAVPDLGINWRIRSIRVGEGEWQLCTGPNYTGECTNLDRDLSVILQNANLSRTRSLRLAPQTPGPGGAGPSLRGMAAEFFTQPSNRGQRILACNRGNANANCARATAAQFCRARGYNYVGSFALQTERSRVYLADVLCKRSAT